MINPLKAALEKAKSFQEHFKGLFTIYLKGDFSGVEEKSKLVIKSIIFEYALLKDIFRGGL